MNISFGIGEARSSFLQCIPRQIKFCGRRMADRLWMNHACSSDLEDESLKCCGAGRVEGERYCPIRYAANALSRRPRSNERLLPSTCGQTAAKLAEIRPLFVVDREQQERECSTAVGRSRRVTREEFAAQPSIRIHLAALKSSTARRYLSKEG